MEAEAKKKDEVEDEADEAEEAEVRRDRSVNE